MRLRISRIALAALLGGSATLLIDGCAAERGYDGYGYDAEYASYRTGPIYGGDYYYGDYRRRDDWRDGHRIPRDADRVAEGRGELSHTADENGRIYVRDERTGKVIYRGRIDAGETFKLDAERNKALIDGKVVDQEIGKKAHSNEIFFDPGRGGHGDHHDAAPSRGDSGHAADRSSGGHDGGGRDNGGKSGDGGKSK